VTHHVDVESIIRVFIPKSRLCEILLVLRLMVVEPVTKSVVYRDAFALSEVEKKMRFVHTEVVELLCTVGFD
jgi:hypothetical protein